MDTSSVKIKKSNIAVYVVMVIIIIVSVHLNKNVTTIKNIISNFSIPFIMMFFGLSWQEMRRTNKIILLLVGIIWFGYISLHYLIGFHNPYWGN